MYSPASYKYGSVSQHLGDHLVSHFWDQKLRRCLNDWVMGEANALLLRLSLVVMGNACEMDRRIWSNSSSGVFSVNSLFKTLEDGGSPRFGCWKFVWRSPIPSRVCFFLWLAYWSKILTVDKIITRGMLIPNRCSTCLMDEESSNHLLIHCPTAHSLWNFFLRFFGRRWALQGDFQAVVL